MSAEATTVSSDTPRMDLSKWRNLPLILIGGGVALALAALAVLKGDVKSFGYAYLVA